jgi:hypothetical protein
MTRGFLHPTRIGNLREVKFILGIARDLVFLGHTALIPRRFLHDHVRHLRSYIHLVSYPLFCADDEMAC